MTSKRHISITLFASFFVLGLTVPLLGVTLGSLTTRFAMPIQNGGLFQVLMSFGVIAGSAAAGRFYDRLNARVMLALGALLLAASMFGLYLAPSSVVALGAALLLGLGFGSFLLGPNILIARLNPDNAAGSLNALNVAYGIGAIAAPQLVTLGVQVGSARLAYAIAGLAMILVAVPLAFVNMMPPVLSDEGASSPRLNVRLMLPFILLFFCAMGAEVSFNAWIVTQLQTAAQAPLPVANLAASAFWIGYTASRLLAAWLGRHLSAVHLLIVAINIVGAGIVLMLLVPTSQTVGIISAGIVGVGIGPLFPTNMALVSAAFPHATGRATGFITAVSNIGPMIIPWLQGRLGAGRDGGMELILVLVVALLAGTLAIGRRLRGPAAVPV
jgi:FHS family glucose/mannose:H+ symporter-like MFS transporter